QQPLARLILDQHIVLLRRPIDPGIATHGKLLALGHSTVPRPRGTVTGADRQGPPRGYVLSPLAAPHHRRDGLVFRWPSHRQAIGALPRRRSRPNNSDLSAIVGCGSSRKPNGARVSASHSKGIELANCMRAHG